MNDSVQRQWDAALAVLKPTEAELQHGLELHRNSLVCDTYGFAPRAVIDGDEMKARMEAGASAAEINDMHEDMTMTRWATDPVERAEFLEAFDFAGVTCIFQNAGEEGQEPQRLLKRLARFTYATDVARDDCFHATHPNDILRAHEQGKHCLYFSGNGVPQAQDYRSVEDEMRYIRIFFQLGIRMMHLTYNRRNMIGDGCAEPSNAGLSDFGRAVVAEMNKQGVIVDCAHSGWQTSLEAAQASTKPMVASHSGVAALNPHHRCKPDEVIRAICDTGGYVGICWVGAFMGGEGTLASVLDHADYIIRNFGADYVGFGTDVAYSPDRMSAEWAKLPPQAPQRKRWANFWWPNDPLFDQKWHEPARADTLAWTNWPLITVGLVQRGHSDEDIQKIIGGNMIRVAKAALE